MIDNYVGFCVMITSFFGLGAGHRNASRQGFDYCLETLSLLLIQGGGIACPLQQAGSWIAKTLATARLEACESLDLRLVAAGSRVGGCDP